MARTRSYCGMSLDGFIAESNDALGWLLEYEGAMPDSGYERFYAEIGAHAVRSAARPAGTRR